MAGPMIIEHLPFERRREMSIRQMRAMAGRAVLGIKGFAGFRIGRGIARRLGMRGPSRKKCRQHEPAAHKGSDCHPRPPLSYSFRVAGGYSKKSRGQDGLDCLSAVQHNCSQGTLPSLPSVIPRALRHEVTLRRLGIQNPVRWIPYLRSSIHMPHGVRDDNVGAMMWDARRLIEAFYAAFNAGDLAGMLACVADDLIHEVNQGAVRHGKAAFTAFCADMNAHYREKLSEIVIMTCAGGTRAAAEFVVDGEYLKTSAGSPPAHGQRYRLRAGTFFEIAGGKITRVTTYYNAAEWARQVSAPASEIIVRALKGPELRAALGDLARLRITVFRDYPYLYEGSLDYEKNYLDVYAKSEGAIIIAAFDGDKIVGIATAAPMEDHAKAFAKTFKERGYDPEDILYCGELVLLPEYRGRGIGHKFFDLREAHGRALGRKFSAFCGVIRPEDHPMRPADYRPLDGFWQKRGYQKLEGFIANLSWPDVGESGATEKPMQFWIRAL